MDEYCFFLYENIDSIISFFEFNFCFCDAFFSLVFTPYDGLLSYEGVCSISNL